MPIIDASTGQITKAQIFVATFGASNYTYACATARQTTADWVGAQIQALEFFGGVPRLIVPDQVRALIKNPDRYDPQPNRLYDEFANHYGCALLAARPAHPRDKPKVENAVLVVERWILARLRNRRFFHLAELNQAIAELLVDLNQRAFNKLPGCRRSAFEQLDAPALPLLPAKRFEIFRWKSAKVNIDYHVQFESHYYSVPHALAHQAARSGFSALYVRAGRLFNELHIAHGDGSFARRLTQLAKLDLLVIDDFAISPIGAAERNDLLEVLDDRVDTLSTLITSQLPVKAWHTYLDDPALADAILDQVVHSSHRIDLKGATLRDKKKEK